MCVWAEAQTQTQVVVEVGVDDAEDAREGAERGGHADLVLVEVRAETLHQVRKAPERGRLVAVQHVVDDGAQVVHALRVAQVLVVRDERHQDVAQLVQALLLLKERVVPVRPHNVLVCVCLCCSFLFMFVPVLVRGESGKRGKPIWEQRFTNLVQRFSCSGNIDFHCILSTW